MRHASGPTRLLFLSAQPEGKDPLNGDDAHHAIEQAIANAGGKGVLTLASGWAVGPTQVQRSLNEHRPHVLHFHGHGDEKGRLVLEWEGGRPMPVRPEDIVDLLKTMTADLRLVFFAACHSEQLAEAAAAVVGLAIGMRGEIEERAATQFAASFYEGIAAGHTVQDAFEQAQAVVAMLGLGERDKPRLCVRPGVDAGPSVLIPRGDVHPDTPHTASLQRHRLASRWDDPRRKGRATIARISMLGLRWWQTALIAAAVIAGVTLVRLRTEPPPAPAPAQSGSGVVPGPVPSFALSPTQAPTSEPVPPTMQTADGSKAIDAPLAITFTLDTKKGKLRIHVIRAAPTHGVVVQLSPDPITPTSWWEVPGDGAIRYVDIPQPGTTLWARAASKTARETSNFTTPFSFPLKQRADP